MNNTSCELLAMKIYKVRTEECRHHPFVVEIDFTKDNNKIKRSSSPLECQVAYKCYGIHYNYSENQKLIDENLTESYNNIFLYYVYLHTYNEITLIYKDINNNLCEVELKEFIQMCKMTITSEKRATGVKEYNIDWFRNISNLKLVITYQDNNTEKENVCLLRFTYKIEQPKIKEDIA